MTLALLCTLSAVQLAAPADDLKSEQAKFDGRWAIESIVAEGEALPAEVVKAFSMNFKGDTYTVTIGKEKTEGTFVLGPGKEPKTIDIIPDNGPDRGRVQRGLYEFAEGKLRIVAAQPGQERPDSFDTKGKAGRTLMILKKP